MKRTQLFFLILALLPACARAEYAEIETSQGKIIRGIDRDTAVKNYGYPQAVGSETWLYRRDGQDVYVFLPASFQVRLYPKFIRAQEGAVLEFKVFAGNQDDMSREVTPEAALFCSDPSAFTANDNIFLAERAGEFTVIARYRGKSSNPCRVKVLKKPEGDPKEQLLKIEALPYAPVIYEREELQFLALGVYVTDKHDYFVRDISDQASWSVTENEKQTAVDGPRVYFPVPEQALVSCELKGIKAYPQTVTVEKTSLKRRSEEIRRLTILPEFIATSPKKNISFAVFATYEDNRVRNITGGCRFEMDGPHLKPGEPGEFTAVSDGICEITAALAGHKSGKAKVIVSSGKGKGNRPPPAPPEESKISPNQVDQEIEKELKQLSKKVDLPGKKVVQLLVSPAEIALDLGQTGKAAATAVHSDGSRSEATLLSSWKVGDTALASADKGTITPRSPGQTTLTAEYKGVNSLPARLSVKPPRLVSIALTPDSLRLSMFDRPALKAEGIYSDNSRADLTAGVSWRIEGRSASVAKGVVSPLRFGTARVFAGKDGVESLPASVTVRVTALWVLFFCAKLFLFLLAGCAAAGFVLFLGVRKNARRIRDLRSAPGPYVIALYVNLKRIFSLFGLAVRPWECPRQVARSAEERFALQSRFAGLTGLFEEARYSGHAIPASYAQKAEGAYSIMIQELFRNLKVTKKAAVIVASLLRKTPLSL